MALADRRGFLAGVGSVAMTAAPAIPAPAAQTFRNALSLSPFAEYLLNSGVSYTDGRRVARTAEALQKLFVAHGSTEVFARIGTRRNFKRELGDQGVNRGLDRARLAKRLGRPLNPELGLFAYYGDASHQPEPDFSDYPQLRLSRPWHEMTIHEMASVLKDYGALIAAEIVSTGARVDYWDLGNEVEFGVAGVAIPSFKTAVAGWTYRPPNGVDPEIGRMDIRRLMSLSEHDRLAWLSRHLWPNVGRIFKAVADGVRSVDRSARFSTHVSGASAYSARRLGAFFGAMDEAGYRVDQLGTSLYPSGSAEPDRRFDRFKQAAAEARVALERPVFVAEFGYPVGPFRYGGVAWDHPVPRYPISVRGQADLIRDLVAWGAGTGHLAGLRPWAPEVVAPAWAAMSLFDLDGREATSRPSLSAIAEGLGLAARGRIGRIGGSYARSIFHAKRQPVK
ncbi:MAG: glycosyl hydrolase 53 family protein [Caulobacteraceae bacterium]